MKKIVLLAFAITYSFIAFSQCDPNYDFGGSAFGVSPDPSLGESFNEASLGEPYNDVIHIIVPVNAGDVNELFDGYMIDSLTLDSVTLTIDEVQVPLQDIGLDVLCNNNGDSENACTFIGGNQYCASVEGTPNMAGEFPLQIHVTGYLNLLGEPTPIVQTFEQYNLIVSDGTIGLNENGLGVAELQQNIPNPFNGKTTINYTMTNGGQALFKVINLLGDVVYTESLQTVKGQNSVVFDANALEAGIYLYSIETSAGKFTKRMIVR